MSNKNSIPEMEKNILKYWQEGNFFQKSVEERPKDNTFVFYDGPPFATGLPHHGSLLASVIKDLIPRYKTMRGFRVERKWGWDCHGLPIENLVEKELGLNSKADIEELGIDKFTNACRASVLKYDREWKQYVDRTGRWIDFDNSYKTMDNSYIESVWWGFSEIYKKGLAYEGRHISLYCPRCATPLSNFEIAMDNSYQDVTDISVYPKFKLTDEDAYLVAWTTTPWTLPGNVGLVVDAKADYVLVDGNYVAKDLAQNIFGEDYKADKTVKGADLVGKSYEPLYNYLPTEDKEAYKVWAGDFVTMEDGTGIVHTAAMYGEDDYKIALEKNMPTVPMLDENGKFLEFVEAFAGMFFKDSEEKVVEDLDGRGLLLRHEPVKHSYPFCWRCETPLYYNAVPAWFINVQQIKDRMLELNEQINWYPEHLKHGRFKHGLENAPDWNISRNRYWGSPIPVWQCSNSECTELEVLSSIKELQDRSGKKAEDLHLPAINDHVWDCDKCDGQMTRVSQVFDCWVESGSMPFASVHYPFENKEQFESNFPGEFIAEYIAQTRGWFYTLHVLSTAIFDKPSFVNAVTTGTILAADGKKISKSKKNYTDPLELFDQYGADSFRLYLMTTPVMQAENLNFSDDGVKEVFRKVVMMILNIHSLYAMYDNELNASELPNEKDLTVLDKWILAKYTDLHEKVTKGLDQYDVVKPGRAMIEFINDLSTWYLRRSRDRFKGDDQKDKEVALAVTRFVHENLLKMLAPYVPFVTEHLYQKLYPEMNKSIHLELWPEAPESWMKNEEVMSEMDEARNIIEAALASRAEAKIKVRQACERLLVESSKEVKPEYQDLIKEEVNVKDVQVVAKLEEQDGYQKTEGQRATVALKTELTNELLMEGLMREMVRQINFLRKEAGFTIEDSIKIHYQTDSDFVEKTIENHGEEIQKQTLSQAILPEPVAGDIQSTVKFNEHSVQIGIIKA